MSRAVFLSILLSCLWACASSPHEPSLTQCFVEDRGVARAIAAAVIGVGDGETSVWVEDAGAHWQVSRTPPTSLEGDRIVVSSGGFSFEIDKCSGAISNYRAWH